MPAGFSHPVRGDEVPNVGRILGALGVLGWGGCSNNKILWLYARGNSLPSLSLWVSLPVSRLNPSPLRS